MTHPTTTPTSRRRFHLWWIPAGGAAAIFVLLAVATGVATTGHLSGARTGWLWPASVGAVALLAALLLLLAAVLRQRLVLREQLAGPAGPADATATVDAAEGDPVEDIAPQDDDLAASAPPAGPTDARPAGPAVRSIPSQPPAGTTVCGYLRDPVGDPVAGAVLTLIGSGGDGHTDLVHSGPDGWYELSAPRGGRYTLIARAAGHAPRAVPVAVGSAPVLLDVALAGSTALVGSVLDEAVGAVPAATVALVATSGDVLATTRTDERGRYRFAELTPGSVTVVASAAGYRPAARPGLLLGAGIATLDIELQGTVTVAGTARGGPRRRPLPDALIAVYDRSGACAGTARTDREGRYQLDELAVGEYTVVAAGFPAATSQVRLRAGQQHGHDILLGHRSGHGQPSHGQPSHGPRHTDSDSGRHESGPGSDGSD